MNYTSLPLLKKGKYHIITFGCAMNFSDSERITTVLESQGYIKSLSKYEADLVVIVACAIRQHAVDRVFGNIGEIKKKNPKVQIIITGCLLENDISRLKKSDIEYWRLTDFTNSINKSINGFFEITPKYRFKNNAYVPIMTGCNNFCSYCAVPYTRGREYSRPANEIICEITQLVKNGCKEIILLGQNVNSYNGNFRFQISNFKKISNIKYPISKSTISFPQLLKIINNISGDFKIKFLTSHPKDMSDELIEAIANCEKVDKERLHLPIQSGDDVILDKMNRKYTVGHYKNLIKKIRAKLPDIQITTDIIVGFPGETEKQFKNTVQLFKEIGFSDAYISCYSPRTGTVAERMGDNISKEEKKERKEFLEKIISVKS